MSYNGAKIGVKRSRKTFVTEEKTQRRRGIVHINHEYCKRCGICVNFCPVKNLIIQQQKLTELKKCIACRMCQRYCPDMAIEIEEIDAETVTTGKSGHNNGG